MPQTMRLFPEDSPLYDDRTVPVEPRFSSDYESWSNSLREQIDRIYDIPVISTPRPYRIDSRVESDGRVRYTISYEDEPQLIIYGRFNYKRYMSKLIPIFNRINKIYENMYEQIKCIKPIKSDLKIRYKVRQINETSVYFIGEEDMRYEFK